MPNKRTVLKIMKEAKNNKFVDSEVHGGVEIEGKNTLFLRTRIFYQNHKKISISGSIFLLAAIATIYSVFFQPQNQTPVNIEEQNTTTSYYQQGGVTARNIEKLIIENKPNENLKISILKFGSPSPIDNLFFETIISNEGSKNAIISKIELVFSEDESYNGRSFAWQTKNSFIIKPDTSIPKKIIFGENKNDLLSATSFFSGQPFHLNLVFTIMSTTGKSHTLLLPIIKDFRTIDKLNDYLYTKGLPLPINIQLLPYEESSDLLKKIK